MKKSASVYFRKGIFYMRPSCETTAGVDIDTNSIEAINSKVHNTGKGEALIRALSQSTTSIAHPTSWTSIDKDPLWGPGGLAGVSSWRTFVNGAAYVRIAIDSDCFTLEPSKNQGAEVGFTPLVEKRIHLPIDAPPNDIGSALDRAIQLCEPTPPDNLMSERVL